MTSGRECVCVSVGVGVILPIGEKKVNLSLPSLCGEVKSQYLLVWILEKDKCFLSLGDSLCFSG